MEHEDKDMSYGSVNPSEIATLSLLGGSGIGYGNHADAAKVAYSAFQHNDTREEVRAEGDQSANRDAFAAVQTVLQGNRQEGMFFQAHLDSDRKFQTLQSQATANAMEAMKCCCETQKLVMTENEKTRDLINSQEIDRLRSQLNNTNSALYAHQASTRGSMFVDGNITTSNNSGQIS